MVRIFLVFLCLITSACSSTPTFIPTPPKHSTDPELDAAIQQARDTLNIFVDTIATPHPNRTYAAVKVRFFPPEELPQDLWVENVTVTNRVFHGEVGDDIPGLRLEAGEMIKIKENDILDWMIVEDGKLVGGYTIRLAYERMTPEEKEFFLKTLDYSIED